MLFSTALGLIAVCSLGAVAGADRREREQSLDHGGRELGAEESPINDAYMSTYEIVATWPHDPRAFTQGLVFAGKELYESDGLYKNSKVRHVDVATGSSHKATANSAHVRPPTARVARHRALREGARRRLSCPRVPLLHQDAPAEACPASHAPCPFPR